MSAQRSVRAPSPWTQALVMAAIFEILGATIAGGPVIKTISSQHRRYRPHHHQRQARLADDGSADGRCSLDQFRHLDESAGFDHACDRRRGGRAPALRPSGRRSVNWRVMADISAGWVVTPLLGGAIAAGILFFIKTFIIYRDDKIAAAKYWIPILIGLMAGAFTAYLVLQLAPKGTVVRLLDHRDRDRLSAW